MNKFIDLARSLINRKEAIPCTLWSRAVLASLNPSIIKTRPYTSPNYISDLGLHTRLDPHIYLSEVLKKIDLDLIEYENSFSVENFYDKIVDENIREYELAYHFDVLVNFAGQWESAHWLAEHIWLKRKNLSNYLFLTYIAAILSCDCNQVPITIYEYLKNDLLNDNIVEKIATDIRESAYLIKRLGRIDDGLKVLASAVFDIKAAEKNYHISDGDAKVLIAAVSNLKALAIWKKHDFNQAYAILNNAYKDISSVDGQVFTGKDEKLRIWQQIAINRIQMKVINQDLLSADSDAASYLQLIKNAHMNYQSEALSILCYIKYLQNNFDSALKFGEEALLLSVNDGAITQMNSVRKILAVSYQHCGFSQQARAMLADLHDDPAGFSSALRVKIENRGYNE